MEINKIKKKNWRSNISALHLRRDQLSNPYLQTKPNTGLGLTVPFALVNILNKDT